MKLLLIILVLLANTVFGHESINDLGEKDSKVSAKAIEVLSEAYFDVYDKNRVKFKDNLIDAFWATEDVQVKLNIIELFKKIYRLENIGELMALHCMHYWSDKEFEEYIEQAYMIWRVRENLVIH